MIHVSYISCHIYIHYITYKHTNHVANYTYIIDISTYIIYITLSYRDFLID